MPLLSYEITAAFVNNAMMIISIQVMGACSAIPPCSQICMHQDGPQQIVVQCGSHASQGQDLRVMPPGHECSVMTRACHAATVYSQTQHEVPAMFGP